MADEEENIQNTGTEIKELHARNEWLSSLLVSFILLFLLSGGLLAYYQFYRGNGNWHFSLKHKNNDTSFQKAIVVPVENDSAQRQSDSLKTIVAALKSKIETDSINQEIAKSEVVTLLPPEPEKVKPYVVQIGIFRNFDLDKYLQDMQHIEQHTGKGLNTLTIGRFNTQKEAELFAKDMKALGISAPVIAKVVDGKVIPIKAKTVAKKKKATKKKRR